MKPALALAAALLLAGAPALAGELTGPTLVPPGVPLPRPMAAGDVVVLLAFHDGGQVRYVPTVTVLQSHALIGADVCGPATPRGAG